MNGWTALVLIVAICGVVAVVDLVVNRPGRRQQRGSHVIGDVTLPDGYEPPSGLLDLPRGQVSPERPVWPPRDPPPDVEQTPRWQP